jgi:ABC-2 type transport system permease protein
MVMRPAVFRPGVALGNEVGKGLEFAWSERLQILFELPFFVLFALLLGPVIGAAQQIATGHVHWSLSSGRTSLLVLFFLPTMFFYMQAVKLFWRLLGELQSGTLEQVYLSPLPSWLVAAAGRLVAALAETVIAIGVIYGVVSAFVPLHYQWHAGALLPLALLVVTGVGYSLIIGGLALAGRHIQMLQEGMLMLTLLFSMSAVPLFTVPGWFAAIGHYFPVTAGVGSLYGVLLGHRPVTALWGTGGLVWVLVTAAAYLAAGVLAFRLGERSAKRRGTLGQY